MSEAEIVSVFERLRLTSQEVPHSFPAPPVSDKQELPPGFYVIRLSDSSEAHQTSETKNAQLDGTSRRNPGRSD